MKGRGAAALEKLRLDVLWECESAWKGREAKPWVAGSEIEALNAKLDGLAATVAALVSSVGGMRPPDIRLLDIGEPATDSLRDVAGSGKS